MSKHELSALILSCLVPLAFGCVKLKALDCASSPEGCEDPERDARAADGRMDSPDAQVEASADTRPPDLAADRMEAAVDSARLPDSAELEADGALPDTTRDAPVIVEDAPSPDAPAKEGGIAPDVGRPDMAPAAPDAPQTPDARTPDLARLPDVSVLSTVTFNAGAAKGVMSGYGWVTMGALDIVSSPTCGPTNAPITSASSCLSTSTNWASSNALCVSGTIPALPPTPTATDYSDNWGIQVGANASDPVGALGQSYVTITLNFTGSPQTGLRATVHRTGDAIGASYCALVTSGVPMALTSFNTSCWNNSGTSLTTADLPKIDKVGLEVPSTQSEITVTNLCLTSIVLGR